MDDPSCGSGSGPPGFLRRCDLSGPDRSPSQLPVGWKVTRRCCRSGDARVCVCLQAMSLQSLGHEMWKRFFPGGVGGAVM